MSVHRSHPRHPSGCSRVNVSRMSTESPKTFAINSSRYLTVVHTLDGEHDVVVFGRGGDCVAATRLEAVLGGQAHVDMLPRAVPRPRRQRESDALRSRSFVDELDDGAQLPGQSPW